MLFSLVSYKILVGSESESSHLKIIKFTNDGVNLQTINYFASNPSVFSLLIFLSLSLSTGRDSSSLTQRSRVLRPPLHPDPIKSSPHCQHVIYVASILVSYLRFECEFSFSFLLLFFSFFEIRNKLPKIGFFHSCIGSVPVEYNG